MKKLLFALPILALAPALFAQDAGKDRVESPIKRVIAAPDADKFDLSRGGIDWKKGLKAVLHQGKPILLFQLLGNFDDVYC